MFVWVKLTALGSPEQGHDIIYRLIGEEKSSAKYFYVDIISAEKGV